jgi:hypothetical protein
MPPAASTPSRFAFSRRVRHPRTRRLLIALAIVLVVLLVARIAAPGLIRDAINDRLSRIDGYASEIADVDLQLFRGAYRIKGLRLDRRVADGLEPFLASEEIDFSLAWRALLQGRVLSDIVTRDITFTYVPTPEDATAAPVTQPPWRDVINDLFPIEITRFIAERGSIRWKNPFADPAVDISLEGLEVVATGLRNRPSEDHGELPALISATGTTIGGGRVELQAALDPLAQRPRFELQVTIEEVHLPALNEFLLAHAAVDVSEGRFTLFAEVSARDGWFEGYVKPFFDDVSFRDLPGQEKPVLKQIWQTFVSALVTLLKNKPRDQLATRIPFRGEIGDPEVGLWATIANLFRHGFIQALAQRLEGFARPNPEGAEPDETSAHEQEARADDEKPTAN